MKEDVIFTIWKRNTPLSDLIRMSVDVVQSQAGQISDILESYGALSVSITSVDGEACFDVAASVGEPRWRYQRLSALFDNNGRVEDTIKKLNVVLDSPCITTRDMEDQDWERAWLDDFKPFCIGDNLWVCPDRCTPPQLDGVNLIINPGHAFGTGRHETTYLCLEYLSKENLHNRKVIDFGCGSGILGIAAAKLGAESVIGVDIDPKAVQSAVQNAEINQVLNKVEIYSNETFEQQYEHSVGDLVIANILSNTLIELCEFISGMVSSDGILLLSGILEPQSAGVLDAYESRFEFSIRQKNQWVLLTGTPRS